MFSVHFVWMFVLLVVVALTGAFLIGVLMLVGRSRRQLSPRAMLSPDGRWWWDGREWKLVAPPVPPPAPPA